jgi:hypothetical protein
MQPSLANKLAITAASCGGALFVHGVLSRSSRAEQRRYPGLSGAAYADLEQ